MSETYQPQKKRAGGTRNNRFVTEPRHSLMGALDEAFCCEKKCYSATITKPEGDNHACTVCSIDAFFTTASARRQRDIVL
jgi:hypothetical protein